MTVAAMAALAAGVWSKTGGAVYSGKEYNFEPLESLELRNVLEESAVEVDCFQEDGGEREDGGWHVEKLLPTVFGLDKRQAAVHGDGRPSSSEWPQTSWCFMPSSAQFELGSAVGSGLRFFLSPVRRRTRPLRLDMILRF